MRLRWLWFDYVPPELELSREQRRAVNRRAVVLGRWDLWGNVRFLSLHFLFLLLISGVYFAIIFLGVFPGQAGMVFAITMVLPAWITTAYSLGKTQWPFVWKALREHGYDVCRDCGYLLHGLDESVERCPECGWLREKVPGHESA